MTTSDIAARTRQAFPEALRAHFRGWIAKARRDFGDQSYAAELSLLRGDPLYQQFGLAIPE
jgi:hypothetical protein